MRDTPTQKEADDLYLGKTGHLTEDCFRRGSMASVGGSVLDVWEVVSTLPMFMSDAPFNERVDLTVHRVGGFQGDTYNITVDEIKFL